MGNLIEWLVENESAFRKSRLPSLYSDLSVQKATNPEGYTANVAAWQAALTKAALAGQLPNGQKLIVESSEELREALSSFQYGSPTGLGLVFDESVRTGKMHDVTEFLKTDTSIYAHSWIPSPLAILKWGLRQTGLTGSSTFDLGGRLRNGQLVLIAALEQLSKDVVAAQDKVGYSVVNRVMTRDAFVKQLHILSGSELTDREVEVTLRFLSRDKGILSFDNQTVKFKTPSSNVKDQINTDDATIASLRSLMSNLETQISSLDQRVTAFQASASSAVKNKNKQSALRALRSKKLAEKALQQRSDYLHQLEEVFNKIEAAVDQVQIVNAMESSVGVLKQLNKQLGGTTRVEGVMDNLREQMDEVSEIEQIVQEPLSSRMVLDEAEIDEELENLEKQENEIREQQEVDATRKRLQDLESAEAERAHADKVQSSIEQLERMTIANDSANKEDQKELEKAAE